MCVLVVAKIPQCHTTGKSNYVLDNMFWVLLTGYQVSIWSGAATFARTITHSFAVTRLPLLLSIVVAVYEKVLRNNC